MHSPFQWFKSLLTKWHKMQEDGYRRCLEEYLNFLRAKEKSDRMMHKRTETGFGTGAY